MTSLTPEHNTDNNNNNNARLHREHRGRAKYATKVVHHVWMAVRAREGTSQDAKFRIKSQDRQRMVGGAHRVSGHHVTLRRNSVLLPHVHQAPRRRHHHASHGPIHYPYFGTDTQPRPTETEANEDNVHVRQQRVDESICQPTLDGAAGQATVVPHTHLVEAQSMHKILHAQIHRPSGSDHAP